MWGRFDSDKTEIGMQYKQNNRNNKTGLSPQQLELDCNKIIKENQDKSKAEVKARLFEYILKNGQISICEKDFFADKINHCNIIGRARAKWKADVDNSDMKPLLEKNETACSVLAYTGEVDFSHTVPDWENILTLGVPGLLERIRNNLKRKNLSENQSVFYKSCETAYSTILYYMKRLSDEALRLSTDNDKMKLLSNTLLRLCAGPPETLHEAMELTFIFYYLQTFVECVNIRSLGAIDKLYYKFYKNDIESGRYTEQQLRELIRYFLYRFSAINAIANTPFCICFADKEGKTTVNELTYIIIEEYEKLRIIDPKIHVRYSEDIPEDLLDMLIDMIRKGNNSIVFMNDRIIINGLVKIGESFEDAAEYVPVGCYEPTAFRKEVPCSCSGRINIAKAVELAVNNGFDMMINKNIGVSAENISRVKTFDEFMDLVLAEIKCFIENTIELINGYEQNYIKINPSPVFSATFDECVERGMDAYAGGAKYNNTSINLLGIASAADAVVAIKRAVYDEKLLTLEEFGEILKNNWRDNEKLRLKCKNLYPKFGNNIKEVDEIAAYMIEYAANLINGRKNGRGGIYRCGVFSIDWYAVFGEKTGASADGRLKGEPLSKNLCAVIGRDRNGVTSLINSVTNIDYEKTPNGAVLDIMLHPSAVSGEDGIAAIKGLIRAFMNAGGLAIQCNVLNPDILKDAQKNPEKYETLQVRLCGWNVYFVNLSRREQDEFIRMAENITDE